MRLTEQDKNTLKETHDKWLNERLGCKIIY